MIGNAPSVGPGAIYRDLFEQMGDPCAIHEILVDGQGLPNDYRFLDVNASFEQVTGLSHSDVVGRTVLEVLPDTETFWIETYGRVALSGKSERFVAYSREFDRYFEVSAFSPRPWLFVTVFTDVSAHVQAETALKKSKELVERVFESIHVLIAYMDREFNFLRVNRAYANADGRTPEDFPGKNHFALYPDAENEAIFRTVVATGRPYVVHAKPFTYPEHPERGVTYWDWRVEPVKDEQGAVEGVILSLLNVTESTRAQLDLKRLNEALAKTLKELKETQQQVIQSEKLSALGRLAAGVAHELNNPMMGVLGYVDYARQKAGGTDERAALEKANRELQRMVDILHNMLAFARPIDEGIGPVDVASTIERALALMAQDFKSRDIAVVREVEPMLPQVAAKPGSLQQVVVNLLMNARDALEDTAVRKITVRAYRIAGARVGIQIQDTGPGIPTEVQQRMFDPFFTTKSPGKGTGLGLSISRNIVADLGGTLTCRSGPGEGTTMIVEIPVTAAHHDGP